MKCIDEVLIQRYIDGETSPNEDEMINIHISTCNKCTVKTLELKQKSDHIKYLTGLIDYGKFEIPIFKKPAIRRKTFYKKYKHIFYDASAACILALCLFFFSKPADKVHLVVSYDLQGEFNANLPVSEQEMVITIIDSEGKLTQY